MSVVSGLDGPAVGADSTVRGQVVASYPTYQQAQRAVDHLSDRAFPVDQAAIIGRDLSLVERVTGRLTTARATAMGAAAGGWFGLFIGLFVGLFSTGSEWLSLLLVGLAIGAVWGAIFGFVAHWATHGQRDFASTSALVAARYEVTVTDAYADNARTLLSSLG